MQTKSQTLPTAYKWDCPNCGCVGEIPLKLPHTIAVTCHSCVKKYQAGEVIWDQVYQFWVTCTSWECRNAMCVEERVSKFRRRITG